MAQSRDFFGIAQGKEEGVYKGFIFGHLTTPILDGSLLLIEPSTAAAFAEAQRLAEEENRSKTIEKPIINNGDTPGGVNDPGKLPPYVPGGEKAVETPKRNFYANIELDPIQSKKQFADLVDDVVMLFTARQGVKVKISIEIQAKSETGFDNDLQRAVKENCNVLKFKNAEFEAGD